MKGKKGSLLLAVAAGAMLTMAAGAFAQAPAGGPPGGGPPGGMRAPPDRANTIQRNLLDDAALKLTAAQKAEIDKAADAYVAAVTKIPATQGPPTPEATAARTAARDTLTASVNKVLNDEQKKTWEAAKAARPRGGPGMGGPGMGGPGGPPGGAPRPPGT